VVASPEYRPFGAGGTQTSGSLQFTGHERDSANLSGGTADLPDYMHARFYAANWGRFLSVDREQGRPELPQTWNRYAYALSNPLRMFDPDGNAPKDFKIIHVTVNVVYSNVDRRAPPLMTRSLRERTEAGIIQARNHYAVMGIALHVNRYEGNILAGRDEVAGNVHTPSGTVSAKEFIAANAGKALTFFASPDLSIPGDASAGSNIQHGTSYFAVLTGIATAGDMEHEMAHSFGNWIGTRSSTTNAATDFIWFAERTQYDLFPTSVGFSSWFVDILRNGASTISTSGTTKP